MAFKFGTCGPFLFYGIVGNYSPLFLYGLSIGIVIRLNVSIFVRLLPFRSGWHGDWVRNKYLTKGAL